MADKGGRPFTTRRAASSPRASSLALAEERAADDEPCLKLPWHEREPDDRRVVPDLVEGVAFRTPHMDTGAADLGA